MRETGWDDAIDRGGEAGPLLVSKSDLKAEEAESERRPWRHGVLRLESEVVRGSNEKASTSDRYLQDDANNK